MKEFNLLQALEGKPVITRDGKKVTQITKFDDVTITKYSICGVVEGSLENWNINGEYNVMKDTIDSLDLFMAEETKTIWINVWKHFKDGSLSASVHSRKDKCDKEIDELLSHRLVKTIEITE
jgi:hypothetical protein